MMKSRMAVALLTVSIGGFGAWVGHEGFSPTPYVPTKGDVPTIGHGSTRYEDGTPVRLTDPAISRARAAELARNLMSGDELAFRKTIPNVNLYQGEYDVYMDFVGNFGIGNWKTSSMRKNLLAGNYRKACDSLLLWRRQGGRDCSQSVNWGPNGCKGVWIRQLQRHAQCMAEQD